MKDFLKSSIITADMEEIYSRGYEWRELSGKKVYVSGSYGMLASYIVYYLIWLREKKGIDVTILAQGRKEGKARDRFGIYFDKEYFTYVSENIVSENCKAVSDADYVIHAAGLANPRFYETNPVEVIEPNAIGTYQLLRNCNKDKIRGFLFLSTCDVYGAVDDPDYIFEVTVGKVDPLDPHSCYSESKRIAETLLASYSREYGIRTVIARVGHTYGPTMDLENDPRVFSSFINDIVSGNDICLHSNGRAQRAFCYISDAVAAYMLLLLRGRSGEAYNVTNTDQMIPIRDLAYVIAVIPNDPVGVVFKNREDNDAYLQDTVNKQNRPVEDKLKCLGWSHPVDVKEGFTRVYSFFTEESETV
ncbi:MAG: NAD-dependent epimerase/dehydratase family protein [Lachnospiraceae bacterium]|nr:NAD-dependent epimerase/dehydratase family protein [Lachnospiraceae bacterium]